eukprot:3928466-Prymnesium_polylepis.1
MVETRTVGWLGSVHARVCYGSANRHACGDAQTTRVCVRYVARIVRMLNEPFTHTWPMAYDAPGGGN